VSAITNKTFSEIFRDFFHLDNNNSGITSTAKTVKDGSGNSTAISISDRELKLSPADDSTSTFKVLDKDDNIIFVVDTNNDIVKAGNSQQIVTTSYQQFIGKDLDLTSSYHVAIPLSIQPNAKVEFGTGANPTISPTTIAASADDYLLHYWYIDSNTYIDQIDLWVSGIAVASDTIRFHLISCAVDTTSTATGGDLSDITIHASGSDINSSGHAQMYYQAITPSTSLVAGGRVIFLTIKADSDNTDYSVNARIKYHL